jgi:hypothetical protein
VVSTVGICTSEDRNTFNQLQIGEYEFEKTETFKYLGSLVTADNNISAEIQARLMAGNRCYYVLQSVLKSKTLSQKAKLNAYKTIIRPVVTYDSEDESQINIWERKLLRRRFGPVNDRGICRIRSNKELADLYQETDLATIIKTLRLRWLGHVCRMEEQRHL